MRQRLDRVLVVEDDRVEAELIREYITSFADADTQIHHVTHVTAGVMGLRERRYDVVLLDLNLPDGSGIANLHKVKAAAPATPVIILTNVEDHETPVAAMAEGAQDYLVKRHVTPELLSRSIRYSIARQEAETSLRASEERYALAIAGARDGVWDWDIARGEIHYSPRWLSLLQLSGTDAPLTPGTWFDRVHEDDRTALDHALGEHLRGTSPHLEHEFRMKNGAGHLQWVLCRGVAVRDASGRATRIAGSLTDITDRKAVEAQLVHEVLHDALTGLPNRNLFLDRLDIALKQRRRDPKRLCAVLFVDIDRFKAVNDSLGHTAGDEMLIEFSKRLRMFLRPGDSVARLGGDEFAILLDEVHTLGEATLVAERIHDALSVRFMIAGKEVYATASIGIALSGPEYVRAGDLLRDADLAMYRTKHERSGSSAVFNSLMHESLQRFELESDLRSALTRNELVTYYQPIVALERMQVIGFEALVRWFHPVRGLIGPDEFIPLAEKGGMIGPLSWWVMQEACRQIREWQDSSPDFANLSIGVNVSSRLFSEPDFAVRTLAILERTGLKPEALHLEITENALLQHESATIRELTALQEAGVKFHLDDFGTGYSSLSYLSLFNYDTIKIDRSFIAGSAESPRSRRIVDALLSLGRVLDMDVIAEGVETPEEAQKLRDLDCRAAQGFWFSKPLPSESAHELLVRERARQLTL